ncbi:MULTISPECIES: hypothetical protein [unclassified Dysgonomonas]|uniref:hypothetical protein n=1 Tax=unclassified Dysgonomonas TaxID=2630389 RepID=UPI002473D0C9|nr:MULTISPECIES: hypothetical protein [unclassified Dysgonomonas]
MSIFNITFRQNRKRIIYLFIKFLFIGLVSLSISTSPLFAQVTIGSNAKPKQGALLDLKEDNELNRNTDKGILLPRVNLEDKEELYPMFETNASDYTNYEKKIHTGLIVYNLTDDTDADLCPGPYVWNGQVWDRLWEPCATIFSIDCRGIVSTATVNTRMSKTVRIPYTVNTTPYTVPVVVAGGPVNGIYAVITNQQVLNTTTGYVTVTLTGTPTSAGRTSIPITIGGSSCEISVDVANTISLDCSGVSTTGTVNTSMTKTVQVPYTIGSAPYTVPTGIIGGPVNGVYTVITSQQVLNTTTGSISVTLAGTPTSSTNFQVPVTIGESTCAVTVEMAAPFSLECTDVYVTGYKDVDMSTTTPVVQIPYKLPAGASYSLSAGTIGTYGNIIASVDAQTLNAPSGFINVKFTGASANVVERMPFSINIAGKECSIYLSTIAPPADCPDGSSARAFVFQQGSKWYVVANGGNYNGYSVAQTIECSSEEEALRHPRALQYCGTYKTGRCIKLFNRSGVETAIVSMTDRSSRWSIKITETNGGCWQSIIAYSGGKMESTLYATGNLGAVNVSNGVGYLGVITGTAILTTKPLR